MVLEKTLESPLVCMEIKPVNPKGNQSWIFVGRTDAEAILLWPPDMKSQLIGKDPDGGKDWGQEEKGATDDTWLDGITNSKDMSLSKFRKIVKDRQSMGSQRVRHDWATEQQIELPHCTTTKKPSLGADQEYFPTLRLCTGYRLLRNSDLSEQAQTSASGSFPRQVWAQAGRIPVSWDHGLLCLLPQKAHRPHTNHTSLIQRCSVSHILSSLQPDMGLHLCWLDWRAAVKQLPLPAMCQLKTWERCHSTHKKTPETRAEHSLKPGEPEVVGWRRQHGETGTCSIIPKTRSQKPAGLWAQHWWLLVLPWTLLRNVLLLTLLMTERTRVWENTLKRILKNNNNKKNDSLGTSLVVWSSG